MSVWDRQRQARKKEILKAAEYLFGEVGYSQTTIEAIAERAGVGIATVYKYFGNKARIVDELILPDLEKVAANVKKIISNPPKDPGLAMAELVDKYRLLKDNWSNRKLLRAFSLTGVCTEEVLNAVVEKTDTQAQTHIRDLLLVLRAKGRIRAILDIDDAAMIVFSVLNQHYFTFITHEDIPADKMFADMARRIRLLFEPWKEP